MLWVELVSWRNGSTVSTWCMARNFNVVRSVEERRGMSSVASQGGLEMSEFNLFIDNMELMDISLHGQNFTWFRPNGQSMSSDRFLVSTDWIIL